MEKNGITYFDLIFLGGDVAQSLHLNVGFCMLQCHLIFICDLYIKQVP